MPELQKSFVNPFQSWVAWSQTPLGKQLLAEEQAWLDTTLQDVFGYNAAQIAPPPLDALRDNRMSCRSRMVWPIAGDSQDESAGDCGDSSLHQQSCFVGSTDELPFLTESLDLLVLPHALEVAQDAHQLLREAHRVLIPEGRLVITGFNPYSLWAMRRACRSVNLFPPAGHHWISLPRLKDWLKLLNFDLGAGGASAYGAYVPPFDRAAWLHRFRWMAPAGRRWWPMAGGVYFLMAVKRVHHIQLIGPNWRDKKSLAGKRAAAAPSVRVSKHGGADV
jgi:SAM-dependent methyltransferase